MAKTFVGTLPVTDAYFKSIQKKMQKEKHKSQDVNNALKIAFFLKLHCLHVLYINQMNIEHNTVLITC